MPDEYFFLRRFRISFSMIGLTSVSMISSWSVRYRPAMKSAASTFSSEFFSLSSNSVSISDEVDSVIILWVVGCGLWLVACSSI